MVTQTRAVPPSTPPTIAPMLFVVGGEVSGVEFAGVEVCLNSAMEVGDGACGKVVDVDADFDVGFGVGAVVDSGILDVVLGGEGD